MVEVTVLDGEDTTCVLKAVLVYVEIFRKDEQKGVAFCSLSTSTIKITFKQNWELGAADANEEKAAKPTSSRFRTAIPV